MLQPEQQPFGRQTTGIARERTVAADDAVAGDEDRKGVGTVGRGDGPHGPRVSQLRCQPGVGAGPAEGNLRQQLPDRPLKRRSDGQQRDIEHAALRGEIFVELPHGTVQHAAIGIVGIVGKVRFGLGGNAGKSGTGPQTLVGPLREADVQPPFETPHHEVARRNIGPVAETEPTAEGPEAQHAARRCMQAPADHARGLTGRSGAVSIGCHGRLLFAEDEVDGQNQAEESGEVVPAQRIRAHEDQREDGEDRERDDLLDHLELPDREGTAEFGAADAVGRDLKAIFKQGDAPAQQHDGHEAEALEPRFEGDMPVPGQRHESVGDDEQNDG